MLTPEAKGTLNFLMQSIEQGHLQRVHYDKPIQLLVLTSHFAPTGVFFLANWTYYVGTYACFSFLCYAIL